MVRPKLGRSETSTAPRACNKTDWLAVVSGRVRQKKTSKCDQIQAAPTSGCAHCAYGTYSLTVSHLHLSNVRETDPTHISKKRSSNICLHLTRTMASEADLSTSETTCTLPQRWLRIVRLQQPPSCASHAIRLRNAQPSAGQSALLRHYGE